MHVCKCKYIINLAVHEQESMFHMERILIQTFNKD